MRQAKFTKENSLEPANVHSPREQAFGDPASEQRHFGRENSPRFGGRAALVNSERGVATVALRTSSSAPADDS
jgi:hypothetical protein